MTKIISILIAIVLISAAGLMLYPTISDQYNQFQNARRIYSYNRSVESQGQKGNLRMLDDALKYNERLKHTGIYDAFTEVVTETSEEYREILDPGGDGIMGYVEIPKIGSRLPIYHSTDDYGLQRGTGHMEGTALPVGGPSTHCGIAGHRALPSARLFTDLDQMERGDLIYISVLGELLVYQVDLVNVVLPHEVDYMAVEEGEDLLTLVTCTPYGLNTHRLLVRGRRTALEDVMDVLTAQDSMDVTQEWQGGLVCAIPVALLGTLLVLLFQPRLPRRVRSGKRR